MSLAALVMRCPLCVVLVLNGGGETGGHAPAPPKAPANAAGEKTASPAEQGDTHPH
ncbi:hypothetical protein ACWKWK_01885 [Pseudoxanthomonas beigongshangi]